MSRTRLGQRLLVVAAALLLAACSGCGEDQDQDQHQAAKPAAGQRQSPPAGHAGRPGGPGAHGAGQPAVPIAVTASVTGPISSYYRATATLEAEKTAQVLARVTGVVHELPAEEGDRVTVGALLLTIDNAEYRLRLNQAEARTANLRSRYDRLEQMRAEDLATQEEFDAARSELAGAEADEGLARLNVSYTRVAAPFNGAVTARLVDMGQTVSVGDPLFHLADFEPLLARVHVPSREFNRLQRNQMVDMTLDSDGTALKGRITLISPVIDPASGTIKVTVEVPEYPAGTRPGDFAQVRIVTERREDVVLVPRGAVLTDKGETVVYTLADGDESVTAERRLVTVGFTDDENAEIVNGLATGEQVVTRGQRSLKHGMAVRVLEGMGGGGR